MRPFLIQASGQGRETLSAQHFPDCGRAERTVTLLEGLADFIDRVVVLAQLNNQVACGRFLRLGLGSVVRGGKEDRLGLAAEVVAQDIKGVKGVAKGTSDLFGRAPFDEKSAQGFVLAMFGEARFEEEPAELT